MEEEKDWCEKTLEQLEKEIEKVNNEKINPENITYLGEIIDAHKDLMNEYYWKEKICMYRDRYNNYDDYRDGPYGRRQRDGRGRFMTGRRYRGHDVIDEMSEHYGRYSDSKNELGRGNYGAKEDTMKSLGYMLQSVEDFFGMLAEDATSQEEMDMIRDTARRISEM